MKRQESGKTKKERKEEKRQEKQGEARQMIQQCPHVFTCRADHDLAYLSATDSVPAVMTCFCGICIWSTGPWTLFAKFVQIVRLAPGNMG